MELWPVIVVVVVGSLVGLWQWDWPFLPGTDEGAIPALMVQMGEALAGVEDLGCLVRFWSFQGGADLCGASVPAGGAEVEVRLTYLHTLEEEALRVEFLAPEPLVGETYTLRGQVLVHFRPGEGIAIVHTSPQGDTASPSTLSDLFSTLELGKITTPKPQVLEVGGNLGPFQRVLIHVDPDTNFPSRVNLCGEGEVIVEISDLHLNEGQEYRDILAPPLLAPEGSWRWIWL